MSHPTRHVARAFESPALLVRARPPSPRVLSLSTATFAPSPSPLVAPSSLSQTPSPFLPPSQPLFSQSQTPPPFLPPSQPVLPLSPCTTSLSALPLQPALPTTHCLLCLRRRHPSSRLASPCSLSLLAQPPCRPSLSSPPLPTTHCLLCLRRRRPSSRPTSPCSLPFLTRPPCRPSLSSSPLPTTHYLLYLRCHRPSSRPASPSSDTPDPSSLPSLPPFLPDDRVIFVFSERRQPNVNFCPVANRSTRSTWDFDLLLTALLS